MLNKNKPAPEGEAKTTTPPKGKLSIIKKPEPEPEPVVEAPPAVNEAVIVDPDKMTSKQLDKLVADNDVTAPEGWEKFTVAQKRTWLKNNFGDDEAAAPAAVGVVGGSPDVSAPATTGTAVTKKSGSKAVKALSGEVIDPDAFSDVVHTIENLKEKDAKGMVAELADRAELTFIKLGGVLSVIQSNGWYKPYATFKEYVEAEHGIHSRKAYVWVSIYNYLSEGKVPYEKVKGLGWTKVSKMAEILTPDNVDEWVQIASEHTALQLEEAVKNAKKSQMSLPEGSEAAKEVTTLTFKVHNDQKQTIKEAIAKAKSIAATEFDAVALENICLEFLGSAPTMDLEVLMKQKGPEGVLEVFGEVFPDVEISAQLP